MYQWNTDVYNHNGSIRWWYGVPGDQWSNASMRDRLCRLMGNMYEWNPDIYSNNGSIGRWNRVPCN